MTQKQFASLLIFELLGLGFVASQDANKMSVKLEKTIFSNVYKTRTIYITLDEGEELLNVSTYKIVNRCFLYQTLNYDYELLKILVDKIKEKL